MWELTGVKVKDFELMEACLADDYEPFAVSTDSNSFVTVWLKKRKEIEEPEVIDNGLQQGKTKRVRKTVSFKTLG